MKRIQSFAIVSILLLLSACSNEPDSQPTFALAIHGGAGRIVPSEMDEAEQRQYQAKLEDVIRLGYASLEAGNSSIETVEAVIVELENSPLFNAGRGAVFTAAGRNELDASIMDGTTRNSGAVAGVTTVKNPIRAARLVMEESPHVMLAADGADEFAAQKGAEIVEPDYFYTERRWQDLQEKLGDESIMGTVGCVALDRNGHLAAGTSTGGMTAKRFGRIGDSPIIGAGTYADDATCAVSCTGHGEFFIRYVVAYDVSALMRYRGLSLASAANSVIKEKLVRIGARGGAIAIDNQGRISMPFNTEGMFRASMRENEDPVVKLFGEEAE